MPSTLISLSDIIRLNGWFKFFSIRTSSTILFAYCRSVQLRNWMRNALNIKIFASIGTGILWLAGIREFQFGMLIRELSFSFVYKKRKKNERTALFFYDIFLWYFVIRCNKNCILENNIMIKKLY